MSLFNNFKRYDNKVAIVDDLNNSYNYKQVNKDIEYFEQLNKRSLILILSSNNYESLICYIASIKLKIVVMLVDIKSDTSYLKNLINKYRPEYIFKPKVYKYSFAKFNSKSYFKNYELFQSSFKKKLNIYSKLPFYLSIPTLVTNILRLKFLIRDPRWSQESPLSILH